MINLLLFLFAFIFMEFVAWSNHKYMMHGLLWRLHIDHHRKDHIKNKIPEKTEDKKLEKNDLFFLIYAIPAIVLMVTGLNFKISEFVFLSAGITFFGITYLVIHDIIIHKRFNVPFLQKKHGRYLRALIKAHTAHHFPKNKDDYSNFGLLIFPRRYIKE